MSTIDTHLNWGASYVANDLYARVWCGALRSREPSQRAQVRVARASGVALLGVSLLFMSQLGSIQQAWKTTLVLGAGLGVATVLRWLWWRLTAWGELAALVASFAAAPLVLAVFDGEAARMLAGAAIGTASAVAVSLLGPKQDPATLRAFVARVDPPGFWGPYQGEGGTGKGDAPGRLRRALFATSACAVTLLGGTAALVALLFPGPSTGWLGPALLLAISLGAVPLWWRQLGAGPTGGADTQRGD